MQELNRILIRLRLSLASDNTFVILLVKKLYKRIVWHILASLDKTLSLEFNVRFLSHELFVKCLLGLNGRADLVWVQVAHIWEALPNTGTSRLVYDLILSRIVHKAFTFHFGVQNLTVGLVILLDQGRPKELFYRLDSPKFNL